MREPEISLNQREMTLAALKENLRLDGRSLDETRPWKLDWHGGSEGGVICNLGKTSVYARVSTQITKPRSDRPYEGLMSIHFELSPMASPAYDAGRPSEEETRLSLLLEKAIRKSEAVDRESLCIVAGEKVFHLRITLHALANAGNLLDCSCMAAMVALRAFRKPEVEVVGGEVIVYSPLERPPVPLALHHIPLCVSFAYFENFPPVLDPSLSELQLNPSTLSLSLTSTSSAPELCLLSKAGGVALAPDELMDVIKLGSERVRQWGSWLEEEVLKETKRRGLQGAL